LKTFPLLVFSIKRAYHVFSQDHLGSIVNAFKHKNHQIENAWLMGEANMFMKQCLSILRALFEIVERDTRNICLDFKLVGPSEKAKANGSYA